MDFSKTQRILLLIDLNPLLHQNPNPNHPNPYLNSILTASKILLSFHPLSSSLFAFKLFFSSLSPLRSSSALHALSPSVSFDRPSQTLSLLYKTLNSISISSFPALKDALLPSLASNTVGSLLQLMHDYAWESQIEYLPGTPPVIPSNLVVLFSPICKSRKCLAQFLNMYSDDECLMNLDDGGLSFRFSESFGVVNERFVSRQDVHVSWVHVNCENNEGSEEKGETEKQNVELFENGIRRLGWGFCSTGSIILGSALVPFGLIYPQIGFRFKDYNGNDVDMRVRGQLSLEVSDVNGKPLECKCCDLELLNTRVRSAKNVDHLEFKHSCAGGGFSRDQDFWSQFGDGVLRLHVKTVQKYVDCEHVAKQQCDQILVRAIPEEPGKNRNKCTDEFSADRLIEKLSRGTRELMQTNSTPIWHIFLSFLFREGCWASVSILKGNGASCMGFLKPFTAHLALLSIVDNEVLIPDNFGGLRKDKMVDVQSKRCLSINKFERSTDSDIGTPPSVICVPQVDGKRKKIKKLQDLTWKAFCTAAFEFSDFDLAEIYSTGEGSKSKKLKFIKCWMKQIKKSSCYNHVRLDKSKSHQHIAKENDKRLVEAHHQSEPPVCQHFSSESSEMQEGAALVSYSETAETFFHNLPKKIQNGLEADGVDLQILAERLVSSSIHWLRQKQERGNILENQTPKLRNPCDNTLGNDLIALLTREPKDLKKHHASLTSSQVSDKCSTSENVVREYELQILLRMEILRSEVAGTLVERAKRKLVKEICSLLEITQYLVEGGIHGHVSLFDYAERTIRTRYSHNLEDVVQRIYAQLDLLPFGEEEEPQLLLLNSEDSNQSWRDKQDLYGKADGKGIYKSVSLESESSQPLEIADGSLLGVGREEHALKLSEARKRREQAKRFVSFTSWVPDLQRVWAPKQPKTGAMKSQLPSKERTRKERRRASYSVVCETPVTGQKRLHSPKNRKGGGKEVQDHGNNPSHSVSKALFQDDK